MTQTDTKNKIRMLNEIIHTSEHTVFLSGPGISAQCGIPDFRSGKGIVLQDTKKARKYDSEYLLSKECLLKEPESFFTYYCRDVDVRGAEPGETHKKLAGLESAGLLDGIITLNVDGLHQKAGSSVVYEIHGSTLRNYCDRCGKKYPEDYIYDSSEAVPHCECGGMIRPDVTLYGESLPVHAWEGAERLIQKADCLIVGGTSLTVYPAASLVRYYSGGYLVIVNRDATGQEEWADLTFHDSIGEVFSHIDI